MLSNKPFKKHFLKLHPALWLLLCCILAFFSVNVAGAELSISSATQMKVELYGFSALKERLLYRGVISPGSQLDIPTDYEGLGLLKVTGGKEYSVILGKEPVTIIFTLPNSSPQFVNSPENGVFSAWQQTTVTEGTEKFPFTKLLIEAKTLLETSRQITTPGELTTQKNLIHDFISRNYLSLSKSDMIKQLVVQYFLMHEYISYHTVSSSTDTLQLNYREEILDGVKSWRRILGKHMAEDEIVSFCVSFFFKREMVTLAYLLMEDNRDVATCPGEAPFPLQFPDTLKLTFGEGIETELGKILTPKLVTIISTKCTFSMVESVMKARELVEKRKGVAMIIATVEPLNREHLAMSQLVNGGLLLFVNDEKWRVEQFKNKPFLPYFYSVDFPD